MGRPPLGDEGRTSKAQLRITAVEEHVLTEAFGSPGRALRAMLDSYLSGALESPVSPPPRRVQVLLTVEVL